MTKKEIRRIAIVFIFFFVLTVYRDCNTGLLENGIIEREDSTGDKKEVSLLLDADGIFEDYEYELVLPPVKITKQEAEAYFQKAIQVIETAFQLVEKELPIQEEYCDGMVDAKWQFQNREYVNYRGEIISEKIPKEGIVCIAEVTLSCGEYERIHSFPFKIFKRELSKQEQLLCDLEQWIDEQMGKEGQILLQLPTELNGVSLHWSEKKEPLVPQVLLLELVAFVVIVWGRKEQEKQEEKKRIQALEFEYPDIINQLFMLLQSGMTIRQAWKKIANQYEIKRKKNLIKPSLVLEAVVCMNRRILEGESERIAYEKFGEEINVRCYYQLMRTLISHLDKGQHGLCEYLEEECVQAYEKRILTARKLGEEASTKMLLPLMLMMILVMLIVLLPAILEIGR